MSSEGFLKRGAEMPSDVDPEKLDELRGKVAGLMGREFRKAKDAIPQVLNGNGFARPKTDGEKRKRYAYQRALLRSFPSQP